MNDQSTRRLRDALNLAPDGRRIHHWTGRDREKDIATLADAIAGAGVLFNQGETLVQLDEASGTLAPVNLTELRTLIGQLICAVRVVHRDGTWRREFFAYAFEPRPRPDPALAGRNLPPQPDKHYYEPDDQALRQIYDGELLERLPRIE